MASVDPPATCPKCGSAELTQDPDVLDTWFSSWLWTFSPLGWPESTGDLRTFHPTSVLVTAADIIFFWVARMIMASYEFVGEPPFTEVIYTGLVRDAQGRKLSKSLGNSPDPMELMDEYGADALRFVLTMLTPTGADINFGEETVETGRNFCNKIWNATRLLFSNLQNVGLVFPPSDPSAMEDDLWPADDDRDAEAAFAGMYARAVGAALPAEERAPLTLEDEWLLHTLAEANAEYHAAMEARRLNDAAYAAYDCFWHEYCDWYLEAIKSRLHGDDLPAKRTALLVALFAHSVLLRMLHPFLPYITEELWASHLATGGYCMTTPMPRFSARAPFATAAERFSLAKDLVAAARNLRNEMGIAPGRRGTLVLRSGDGHRADLEAVAPYVEQLAKLESVSWSGVDQAKPEPSSATVVGEIEVFLPMAGLVDLDKERERLQKEREGVVRRLTAVQAKLENANFVSKAPAEVVQRERDLARDLEATLGKIDGQLSTLE
jgi:valyl-tRNA synthetase